MSFNDDMHIEEMMGDYGDDDVYERYGSDLVTITERCGCGATRQRKVVDPYAEDYLGDWWTFVCQTCAAEAAPLPSLGVHEDDDDVPF